MSRLNFVVALCAALVLGACNQDGALPPPVPAIDAGGTTDLTKELSSITVSGAQDMPIPLSVGPNAQNVPMRKTNAKSDNHLKATVTTLVYKLVGLGNNSDVSGGQVWQGDGAGLGKKASFDPQSGLLIFTGLTFDVDENLTSWTQSANYMAKQFGGQHSFDLIDVKLADGGTVHGLPLTDGARVTIADTCTGNVLHVPADCPTIQQAVDTAPVAMKNGPFPADLVSILVAPGLYNESVKFTGAVNVALTKDGIGEAVIDGGKDSAIKSMTFGGTLISLTGITLRSSQMYAGFGSATIMTEFCDTVTLKNTTIYTSSIGLAVSYDTIVDVTGSKFVGNGDVNTRGINWYHADAGNRVMYNSFENLNYGVYQCSGNAPKVGNQPGEDTNMYMGVKTPFYQNPNMNNCQ